jgi:hypothetical protein
MRDFFFCSHTCRAFFRKETRSKILRSYARCSYQNKTVRDSDPQESIRKKTEEKAIKRDQFRIVTALLAPQGCSELKMLIDSSKCK